MIQKIMLGKPVIRVSRITAELILLKLGEGATEQDLMQAYPHLTTVAHPLSVIGRQDGGELAVGGIVS